MAVRRSGAPSAEILRGAGARKIFQRYFGGAPWGGQESPVSSIDPAVTQAGVARGL